MTTLNKNQRDKSIGLKVKEQRLANGLTQEGLAQLAKIPYTTLTKIESGAIENPSAKVVAHLASVLGSSLDDFFLVRTFSGKDALRRIFSDALETLGDGGEMNISGIDESRFLATDKKGLLQFQQELRRRNIKQKLISCEGDQLRLEGDHLEYRYIPKEFFNPNPMYCYGETLAAVTWGPPVASFIMRNSAIADAYQKQFNFIWSQLER